MPIKREEFEQGDIGTTMTTGVKILRFLRANDDMAYTRSEIAEAINVKPNTVGTNLSRLKDRNLVRHKGNYWAIIDDDTRLASAFKTHFEDEWLNEELAPEDKTEWLENAADPSEFAETDDDDSSRKP